MGAGQIVGDGEKRRSDGELVDKITHALLAGLDGYCFLKSNLDVVAAPIRSSWMSLCVLASSTISSFLWTEYY